MHRTIKTPYYHQLAEQTRFRIGKKKAPQEVHHNTNPILLPPSSENSHKKSGYVTTAEMKRVSVGMLAQKIDELRESTARLSGILAQVASNLTKQQHQSHNFPLAKVRFINDYLSGKEYIIRNCSSPENPIGFVRIGRAVHKQSHPYFQVVHPTVSRLHTTIWYKNHKLIIVNHSTVNPTKVNNIDIQPEKAFFMPDRVSISIGHIEFIVEKIF